MIESYPGHNHIILEVLRLLTNSVPGFDRKAWITMLTTTSLFLYMVHSVCQMPVHKFVQNVRARPLSFTDSIASTSQYLHLRYDSDEKVSTYRLLLPDLSCYQSHFSSLQEQGMANCRYLLGHTARRQRTRHSGSFPKNFYD